MLIAYFQSNEKINKYFNNLEFEYVYNLDIKWKHFQIFLFP